MDKREWMLKRNCCLTPRQLGLAYGVVCMLSLTVAAFCIAAGVWQIIFFSLLELTVVAIAFLVYARHATDREHIALSRDCLLVEQFDGDRVHRVRLDPLTARVGIPRHAYELIQLESHGVRVEVGRHVTAARRVQIARELQRLVPSLASWHSASMP